MQMLSCCELIYGIIEFKVEFFNTKDEKQFSMFMGYT